MALGKRVLAWRFWMISKIDRSAWRKTSRQVLSYALVGVVTNLGGYTLYLLLTHLGGTPKLTMTALYCVGAAISFIANRRLTFQHDGMIAFVGIRYLMVQGSGYLLNFLLLVVFVDWWGFAHQIVQASAIIVVACYLFVLSKIFVFAPHRL